MAQKLRKREITKPDRVEARVSREQKQVFQHAADLLGLSLSDFLTMSALRAAETAIREHEVITLTARDSLAFAEAFLNPIEPTGELRRSYAHYKHDVISR